MDEQFKRENHYVPRFLLRNFAIPTDSHKVMELRLLVPHKNYPAWSAQPIKSVAKHRDLYTIAEGVRESDGLERWLDKRFETPAQAAVQAVLKEVPLTTSDLDRLCGLYAAQFMRTPAHFVSKRRAWEADFHSQIEQMQARILAERPQLDLKQGEMVDIDAPEGIPLRVRVSLSDDGYRMLIRTVAGRKLWVWSVRQALREDGPVRRLRQYRWTILLAPRDQPWFLSDNPAVSSFTYSDGRKTCFQNWAWKDARLMLPISPRHLLYHRVGAPMREQYAEAHDLVARQIRRDLADAAYRSIFNASEDQELSRYRQPEVNLERFNAEREDWEGFGSEQSEAERYR